MGFRPYRDKEVKAFTKKAINSDRDIVFSVFFVSQNGSGSVRPPPGSKTLAGSRSPSTAPAGTSGIVLSSNFKLFEFTRIVKIFYIQFITSLTR